MWKNLWILLSGLTFEGNNALLSYNDKGFAMLPAQKSLAGNSDTVGFHVTSKRPMSARWEEKVQLYNTRF